MKKLLVSSLLLCTGFSIFSAMAPNPAPQAVLVPIKYMPAIGCLELCDKTNFRGECTRGVIMHALMQNPALQAELQAVVKFDGQGPNLRSYQQIMDNLKNSTSSADALAALQAFERVIMHLYDFRAYAYGSYKPGLSIFATGIKWSWINPANYFNPKNYISDNDPELHQLLSELSNVAKVTSLHSTIEGERMSLTVYSYRNWRKNLTIACTAYLITNLCARGWNDSVLKDIKYHGLLSIPSVTVKTIKDAASLTGSIYSGGKYVAGKACKVAAPIMNVLVNGVGKKEDKKELDPKASKNK
ncbi:MAG: hypothetical protein NTU89_01725 [Candidatus Dependentiae bacterium]|nr:hypothetical protein [Candidatus Dependentiae bacterium]